MSSRAGTPAQASDLIDVNAVTAAYYDRRPEMEDPAQRVAFGTSGHRGSSLDSAFTDTHIAAITQAIVEYRAEQGIGGPIYVGADTHALSGPAQRTALEVLSANGVSALVDANQDYVPTPAISHAILRHNRDATDGAQADGLVITPSHNPPRDGGFKYNPPHGGPADSDATGWIADRANDDHPRRKRRGAASGRRRYDALRLPQALRGRPAQHPRLSTPSATSACTSAPTPSAEPRSATGRPSPRRTTST